MSLSVGSHFVVLYHTLLWEKRKRKPAADDKNHASSSKNPTWKTVLWTSTWTSIPFQHFSLINFPIPCDMTTVIFFAKAHSWKKMTQFQWKQVHENETKRLLGNQSFNKGSLDTITWKRLLSRAFNLFIKTYGSRQSEKNLLLNKNLTNPWTNAPWKW